MNIWGAELLSLEWLSSCEVGLSSLQQAVGSQVSFFTRKGQLVPRGFKARPGQACPVGIFKWLNLWPACTGRLLYGGVTSHSLPGPSREKVAFGCVWLWEVLTTIRPLLVLTPLIMPLLGKGTGYFLEARIRLLLINMNALNYHGSQHRKSTFGLLHFWLHYVNVTFVWYVILYWK